MNKGIQMKNFSSPQSILIVDDHVLFREGLISILQSTDEYQVVDSAGTVKEGIEKALHHKPDIILMDYTLPDGTGLEATSSILNALPDCKIVFLTIYETDETVLAAVRTGAKGYVLKNITGPSLLASLNALNDGELAISRKMMSRALEISSTNMRTTPDVTSKKLSQREIEILKELESGASNYEIANKLYLSENTIKHHIHSILSKLGAENRREAIAMARKTGITRRDDFVQ